MRIVVTGASGFLGGRVLRALSARAGLEVVGISRRDIDGLRRVSDYAASPGGDVLIHLAEESHRGRAAQAGTEGNERARSTMKALLSKRFQRVVYASSGMLYGDTDSHPHSPQDPVQTPDAYALTKRESELAVLETTAGFVVRLANLYGPGMDPGNVLSTILGQIPGTGPLLVMDTQPVRDFLWVDDAAEGFAAFALLDGAHRARGGIFNLGTGTGTSIGDVARAGLEVAGEGSRNVVATGSRQRLSTLILDYADTNRMCGWGPVTALRQGLARMLGKSKTG